MTSKNKNSDRKRSKAEELIDQAVRQVEAEEGKSLNENPQHSTRDEKEPASESHSVSSTGIAQIDVQKFVDREAYLRLAADLENFRKRAIRERQEAERNGRERILRGCLEIFDNLERGLKGAKDQNDPLAEGIRMILSQVDNWLKTEGIQPIVTKGQSFDPAVHEAVSQIERNDLPAGSIVEEVRKGYRWSDRLLRPATVVVSKQSDEQTPSNEASE